VGVVRKKPRIGWLATAAAALLLLPLMAPGAMAQAPASRQVSLDAEAVYKISQAAIGRSVGDHVLTDQNGKPLVLADLRGKPLVVSLIFTSCATVCPVTTDHLRDAVAQARGLFGTDSFNVLTFGFDAANDRPNQLKGFSGTHRLNSMANWQVASADQDTTEAFLRDLGFSYQFTAGTFDHVTQTSILDADGRVYGQIYGEEFPLPVFVQPLKGLIYGTTTQSVAPGDLWNRLTFLCTVYNPLTRAYRFDYGIFFGIFFGALSLILTAAVIIRLWLEKRRAERKIRSGPHRQNG